MYTSLTEFYVWYIGITRVVCKGVPYNDETNPTYQQVIVTTRILRQDTDFHIREAKRKAINKLENNHKGYRWLDVEAEFIRFVTK